jgi:D-alanyl-D-alanine carboxypeptidase/D-alanyl-D-alanine-endopeptidase (penicillin-binding protein 4)
MALQSLSSADLVWAALPAPMAQALLDADIPDTAVSVVVQTVGDAKPAISHRADEAMNPASVMKLLTTYAGLEILGPAYTWKTEALADGPMERGKLRGNLYVKGYGDPKLTIEQFWLLLKRIRAAGVKEIGGDVVLDTSYFAPLGFDPGGFDDKPNRAYNAGPSALLVNYNAVNINFAPDESGKKVTVWVEPGFAALKLVNRVKLDYEACGDWKERLGMKVDGDGAARRVELTGKYSIACGDKNYPLSFFGHQDFARGLFLDLWREMGGKLRGKVRAGEAPAEARPLARLESPALSELIRDMNKWSNNVMARQLYLTLGAQQAGAPASPDKSFGAINQWLAARGMNFPELALENGSGLSRLERISARHLADLLAAAAKSPVMPEFVSSLPIIAIDGTMKKRFKDAALAGQAHIKTGTLTGVKTLAGYVLDRHGRLVVVVSLINHDRAGLAQPAEDALLAWVYEQAQ